MDEPDLSQRSFSRAKREADESPVLRFNQENRERIHFFFWVVSGAVSFLVAVVIVTVAIVHTLGLVEENRKTGVQNATDVASLKGELKATNLRVDGNIKDIEENKRTITERGPLVMKLEKAVAEWSVFDLKEINFLVHDMANQREYGVSNKEWYLRKYGYAAPSTQAAQPYSPNPTPTPRN